MATETETHCGTCEEWRCRSLSLAADGLP